LPPQVRPFPSTRRGKRGVGEPSATDRAEDGGEPAEVGQVALVVGEYALVDVPEQVERLHGHVGPVEAPLQHGPEVLDPVRVYTPVHVALGVVDGLMVEAAL